ncbi:MBL fold metallo-hydrolase [Halobacillus salinus]|uniref:MBL fold metallo-hydrolase n=1 Tax=Halobacillus salinus TaxID=192814 RepID=UPI0009A67599|nr:MBL fold metallo-hydrolase [Halobacillus salinus]
MKITHIRNATMLVEYANHRFLIDPFFADKGSMPPFENTTNQHLNNPLVELPIHVEELLDVDAVFVTHLHPDHFDEAAKEKIPKDMPIYVQNEKDQAQVEGAGFTKVMCLDEVDTIGGVKVIRTEGQHGSEEMTSLTGSVSGIVFTYHNEKTLYIAGDTIWYDGVEEVIDTHRPEVIVVNAGAAQFLEGGPITMTKEDVVRTHEESPDANIVAVHMEALNHCLLTRRELEDYVEANAIASKIAIPENGESMNY